LPKLREALKTLEQLGFLKRTRKAGTYFTRPEPGHLAAHVRFYIDAGVGAQTASRDAKQSLEILRARAALERAVAAEAALHRTTRDLLGMQVAIEALEGAKGDRDAWLDADR